MVYKVPFSSMLPKNRRIPRQNFPYILKNGRRFVSPKLFLYVAPMQKKEASRFSFSLSKKTAPLAVKRNLYRRRGYAVISNLISLINPGFFFFFSFKKGFGKPSNSELEKEIAYLLAEVGVL